MDEELDIGQMIEDCEKRSAQLNDWECEFIDSIAIQYARKASLTPKQSEQLNKIWDRCTG